MLNITPPHRSATTTLQWHDLYHAALFETDRNKVEDRIADAERAIFARIKELFAIETDHIEEDMVLDDALYALRALRNCVTQQHENIAA